MKRVFVQQFFLKKKKDKAIIRNKVKKEQAIMKLSSYLNTKSIFLDLQEESIDEVIKEMVKRISKSEENIKGKEKEIGEAVVKREKEVSTAIGSGIAIPHARIDNFNDFIISIALLKKPLTMNIAGTNKEDKVDFVVLIISDVLKNKNILKTMSAISKMALKNSELLEKIKKSSSSNEVIKRFEEANIEIEHRIIA
ncbi:MAG: PTS sugar transporter subunit IIA, partial [Fusobacteriaceae bacterium]